MGRSSLRLEDVVRKYVEAMKGGKNWKIRVLGWSVDIVGFFFY